MKFCQIPGAEEVEREGEITNKDKDHEHQQQLSQFSKKGIPIEQYTPFQLLCDNILRKIMAKDPEEYIFCILLFYSLPTKFLDIFSTPLTRII